MSNGIDKMIAGYQRYREGAFEANRPLIENLVTEGQHPQVCVVSCVDSRVDPTIVFQADPGDLFVIRNVANLVPAMREDGPFHGADAALEFAVKGLAVKHIVVLGHAQCGGVKAMMTADPNDDTYTFLPRWVAQLSAAHERVHAAIPDADPETQTRACEQQAVLVSVENLASYPWIRERVDSGELSLHGWYIDIASGIVSAYDHETESFAPLS